MTASNMGNGPEKNFAKEERKVRDTVVSLLFCDVWQSIYPFVQWGIALQI